MENPNRNILVPLDFNEQSLNALEMAIPFAKISQSEIKLLYVAQDKGMLSKLFSSDSNDVFCQEVLTQLKNIATETTAKYGIPVSYYLEKDSSIHKKIVDFSIIHQSDIIVMGKGSTFTDEDKKQPMVGSNTSRIIRYSKIPVITTERGPHNHECKNILVPLDLTTESRQKVAWAIKLAHLFHSDITVFSALWSVNDPEIINHLNLQIKSVEAFIRKQGIQCSTELFVDKEGSSGLVPILLNYIDNHSEIDMVMIMTQQELNFSEYFLGSHASELIRKSKIPVMSIIPRDTGEIVLGL